MASISGPHPVSRQLQVKIPVKLAAQLHLVGGDEVFWRLSEDTPGCLVLVPAEIVERRYSAGERLELASTAPGLELRDVGSQAWKTATSSDNAGSE